jgi:hypothetical protein
MFQTVFSEHKTTVLNVILSQVTKGLPEEREHELFKVLRMCLADEMITVPNNLEPRWYTRNPVLDKSHGLLRSG